MKAAVIREYGKIVMAEVEKPVLLNDHVLVRVKYASICGSDQHIFKGEFHPRTKLPLIPGHEFACVIEEVSKEVRNLLPGEKVTEALDDEVLNPESMITRILNLEDAQKGFELLDKEPGKNLKILLKV